MWALIEADFQSEYGIDLEAELPVKTWRWFAVRVIGLLGCDGRVYRHFKTR